MPKATTYAELRALSDEDLIRQYDAESRHVLLSLDFLRQELAHRDQERATAAMLAYTREMRDLTHGLRRLTWVIVGLTLANVVATIVAILLG